MRLPGGGRGYFAPRRRRPQGDGEEGFFAAAVSSGGGKRFAAVAAPSRRLACTRRERKDISQRLAGAVFDPSPRLAGCAFHGGREILSPKTVVFHLLIFPKGLFCHFFDRLNSAKRRSSCDIVAKPCANAKCSRKAAKFPRWLHRRTAAAYAQISPLVCEFVSRSVFGKGKSVIMRGFSACFSEEFAAPELHFKEFSNAFWPCGRSCHTGSLLALSTPWGGMRLPHPKVLCHSKAP